MELGGTRMEGLVVGTGSRRVLVTGNLGYVGPVVTRHLRKAMSGVKLAGLDSGFFVNCLTVDPTEAARPVDHQYFADVRDLPHGCLQNVDAIVHLAAISNDPIGNAYADVTLDINHRATVDLARQAKAAGVSSFVFASSCSVYGAADGARTEASELAPLTPYARSKVLAEQDLAELADDGFTVTSLRFATACGMSDRLRLDLVVNDFVASAVAVGRITLLSDGTAWRPLIHVRDMGRAIEWAIGRQAGDDGAFVAVNAGSDDWNFKIRKLAETVRDEMPGVEIEFGPGAAADARSYRVDFSLFRRLAPGHQPQVTLPETIRELRDGLHAIHFADPDFRASHLVRLRVLEALRNRHRLTETLEWLPAA